MYHAFISYNRAADRELAVELQKSLQSFAKPFWRLRSLRIFRDDSNLAAGGAITETVRTMLDQSAYLILLASPASAKSGWVSQELQHWVETKGTRNLLIVVTSGAVVWNADEGDFDWTTTDALPRLFSRAFDSQPKWETLANLRAQKGASARRLTVQQVTASLFSSITGRPLDSLFGHEVAVYRRNLTILGLGAALIIAALLLYIDQLGKTQKSQNRFDTVFDLLAFRKADGQVRSTFVIPDISIEENKKLLAVEAISAARNIANADLSNVRVLWMDDQPENNEWERADIRDRLHRIGVKFEAVASVDEALIRLRNTGYHAVITNYGKNRCQNGAMAIANCVLNEVKLLPSRPPVIIYTFGMHAEIADQAKCDGFVASVDNPDLLFSWLVRALDVKFKPSAEIVSFCKKSAGRSIAPSNARN